MIHENELLMLLLGAAALVLVWGNHARLRQFQEACLFLGAFAFMLAGWLLTILEGFALYAILNFFEHLCYLIGAIFLALWVWRITRAGQAGRLP